MRPSSGPEVFGKLPACLLLPGCRPHMTSKGQKPKDGKEAIARREGERERREKTSAKDVGEEEDGRPLKN